MTTATLYHYRPVVPEKAQGTTHQMRDRRTKRECMTVLERLLFNYIDRLRPCGDDTVERWIQFAFRLGRESYAVDPEGDTWHARRVYS